MKHLLFGMLLCACAHLTPTDERALLDLKTAQSACIAAHVNEGRPAIDACRAQVQKDWCAKQAERMDAGVCQ